MQHQPNTRRVVPFQQTARDSHHTRLSGRAFDHLLAWVEETHDLAQELAHNRAAIGRLSNREITPAGAQ